MKARFFNRRVKATSSKLRASLRFIFFGVFFFVSFSFENTSTFQRQTFGTLAATSVALVVAPATVVGAVHRDARCRGDGDSPRLDVRTAVARPLTGDRFRIFPHAGGVTHCCARRRRAKQTREQRKTAPKGRQTNERKTPHTQTTPTQRQRRRSRLKRPNNSDSEDRLTLAAHVPLWIVRGVVVRHVTVSVCARAKKVRAKSARADTRAAAK